MLDADLKARWIAALRSGEYEQTSNFLHADGKFCCLGVLCDISGIGSWEPDGSCHRYVVTHGAWARAVLPFSVSKAVGLLNSEEPGNLMCMNDGGKTFPEIADYIEEHL